MPETGQCGERVTAQRGEASLPSRSSRASFAAVIVAAVAAGVLISAILGLSELVIGNAFFSLEVQWALIPRNILLAAVGRAILTHVLFWTAVLIPCGVFYWLLARRHTDPAPEPLLLGLLTLFATVVVLPADLELAGQLRTIFLVVGLIAGLAASAAVYLLLRGIRRRMGRARFQRWFRLAAGVALIVTIVTGFYFVTSPLFNPSAYRVAPTSARTKGENRVNVLWIVLDAARADRLGVYGHDAPTTPFLDEWAQQSLVFDRAIADGIWTLPSHASMFTGLPACTHGCGHKTDFLDDSFQTVADVLRENGYATACFSNNPFVGPQTNLSKGFDTPLVLYHFQRATRFSLALLWEKLGVTPPFPWLDYDYGAALTNCLVARWLDERPAKPLFVLVNYMESHLPYRSPERYRKMFLPDDGVERSYELRRKRYGELEKWLGFDANVDGYEIMSEYDRDVVKHQYESSLRYLDDRVRELIELFRQRGLLDNTLVVIAADHGEYLDTHGLWSHYFLTYQDVIHVPLLLRPPGLLKGRHVANCVQLSELYPTVLRAAAGSAPPNAGGSARDLLALAAVGGSPHIAISEYFGPEPSIEPRLLAKRDAELRHRAAAQIAAVDLRFKYIRSGDGRRELYDLRVDPGELFDLVRSRPTDAQRFEQYIESWLKTVPEYRPEAERSAVKGPGPDTMRLLKSLGYVGDDD